jgi:hypothetical protein
MATGLYFRIWAGPSDKEPGEARHPRPADGRRIGRSRVKLKTLPARWAAQKQVDERIEDTAQKPGQIGKSPWMVGVACVLAPLLPSGNASSEPEPS